MHNFLMQKKRYIKILVQAVSCGNGEFFVNQGCSTDDLPLGYFIMLEFGDCRKPREFSLSRGLTPNNPGAETGLKFYFWDATICKKK